jgi:hypothetical protein
MLARCRTRQLVVRYPEACALASRSSRYLSTFCALRFADRKEELDLGMCH